VAVRMSRLEMSPSSTEKSSTSSVTSKGAPAVLRDVKIMSEAGLPVTGLARRVAIIGERSRTYERAMRLSRRHRRGYVHWLWLQTTKQSQED
jgi:hypothetical protein